MTEPYQTPELLREHYEIERELASRLRNSTRDERVHLYRSLYDELLRRVPHHPMLTRKVDAVARAQHVQPQLRLILPFLEAGRAFLEIGAGDCALASAVAKYAGRVYAVDVSTELPMGVSLPDNVQLVLSRGTDVPVPSASIHVAYSNQLMEHLHPDDAVEQLEGIYEALTPGGVYICATPNGVSGPHDVSKYFDEKATGFHLKEYTVAELTSLFRKVGFRRLRLGLRVKRYMWIPPTPLIALERGVGLLPRAAKRRFCFSFPGRKLFLINILLAARKPGSDGRTAG